MKTEKFLKECENRLNELLNANGEVNLYEIYTIIGFIDENSEKGLPEEYIQQLKTTRWKKGEDGLVSFIDNKGGNLI